MRYSPNSIYPDGSSVRQIYNPCFLTKTERIKNESVVYNARIEKFDLSGKPKRIHFPKSSGIRKMSLTTSGKITNYLYDGHEEIGSYNSERSNLDLKILSGNEGSIPIAVEMGEQNYCPIISVHGHIVGLVEMETGNLADKSLLTMFGEDLSEKLLSPWRFCGKRHESSELGIIDFGYRFYHPKSAQWLTLDPLGEAKVLIYMPMSVIVQLVAWIALDYSWRTLALAVLGVISNPIVLGREIKLLITR